MQIRYPPAAQLLLAISSLVLSKVQDVIGSSGVSCLTWSTGEDGLTRVTFLAPDTAGVRSLYISLWSEDMRLVTCEVNTNPITTDRYLGVCDGNGTRGQEISQRFNISALLAPEAPCAHVSSSASELTKRATSDGTEGRTRRKRSWIFPGTLWCGTGSRADIYDQLGMFESTDRCCREHDHCQHIIPALTVNYGVFNRKFFTVSHCDCDQRFRQCLLQVNDSISSMVGYSFFNILQVPCFELQQRQRCSQMYWWGMCKKANKGPYAIFKDPLSFNTTEALSQYEDSKPTSSDGQHVTESPMINTHITSPRGGHRCSSEKPPGDNPSYRRGKKGKGCKRRRKLYTAAAPSQRPSTSTAHTTPTMETSSSHSPKTSTIMTNKKRAGKKKNTRKGLPVYPTHSSQVVTSSYPQTSSTHGTPSTTQTPAPQLYSPTAVTAITKTSKPRKKIQKQTNCCGHRTPLRGDTFQPHCRSCQEQKPTPHKATVTLSMTTQVMTPETTKGPKQGTWSMATSAAAATTKPKTATSNHEDGEPQKQINSHQLLWNNTTVKLRTKGPKPHTETGLKLNIALHNITDSQRLCRNLKLLDDCKFKIPPLEKKYGLQNKESKTAYHCDCTRRLAAQIKSFKQPGILPTLLMDFVSQRCFKLPKEKKCHGKKSCSGGFTKASGLLLRVLKKIEEKGIAGVLNSGNGRKRGIPVRLYKRCLRLEREADIMAQLTRL